MYTRKEINELNQIEQLKRNARCFEAYGEILCQNEFGWYSIPTSEPPEDEEILGDG
jgi:hypothetical protein